MLIFSFTCNIITINMHLSCVFPDSTLQTPDSVERHKLAIVQEVLYGHDKVSERKQLTFYDATTGFPTK